MTLYDDLRGDARGILTTATARTYRPLVAWAMGAHECKTSGLSRYWRTGDPRELRYAELGGESLDHGRWLDFDRSGVVIRDGDLPKRLTVTWTEITQILKSTRVSSCLIAECHAASAEQNGLVDTGMALTDEWRVCVARCRAASAAIWSACRPADQGEQLSLFDELVA